MNIGPVEYLEIAFPGNRFNGKILPALQKLVDDDTINIIDLVLVYKSEQGEVTALELHEVEGDLAESFKPLQVQGLDLFNLQDIALLASDLDNNSSAALMVFENVWATRFMNEVRASGGVVVSNARIAHDVVVEVIEAAKAAAS